MITAVYSAKRRFFHRLAEIAAAGGPWAGIQVAYCWPGENAAQPECVYGGQGRFEHPGDGDLIDGEKRLIDEDMYFWVHVQVTMAPAPPGLAEDSDRRVEEILNLLALTIINEPRICGDRTEASIRDGQADYMSVNDGIVSNCSVQIGLRGYIDPFNPGS